MSDKWFKTPMGRRVDADGTTEIAHPPPPAPWMECPYTGCQGQNRCTHAGEMCPALRFVQPSWVWAVDEDHRGRARLECRRCQWEEVRQARSWTGADEQIAAFIEKHRNCPAPRPAPVEPSAEEVERVARALHGRVESPAHTFWQPWDSTASFVREKTRGLVREVLTVAAALRSEPRPQPTSEELREKLDAYRDSVSRHTSTRSEYCDSCNRKRAAVERLFASSQERYNELIMAVASKCPGESRHETALRYVRQGESQSFTRDEVLRIATAAATMHSGYPGKGWDAADAALMAIEAYNREDGRGEPPTGEDLWEKLYEARQALRSLQEGYNELIMEVRTVHPGESRHETALRYVRQSEEGSSGNTSQVEAGIPAKEEG